MIPLLDLKAQYLSIKSELDAAVLGVLENAQFILGPEVAAFEQEFARYCGSSEAIGVNSGTSALHLALLACGIGPGDEVITSPFTFVASAATIVYTGARPVFVDIDPASFNIDVTRIAAAITPRTKAIMPVHLFGQTADMDPIMDIARRHGLLVVEDAAQAHGAEYKGRRAGSIGHLGCFSFYPGKNLGACGEGGAVVTNNPAYARQVRMLRDWGAEQKYVHELKGYNYRMEGMQGAILRVKLRHLERDNQRRREIAARYLSALADCARLTLPCVAPGNLPVWHLFVVRSPERAALQRHLQDAGIGCMIHYPTPPHLQPAYADAGWAPGSLPLSERIHRQVLSLPMAPTLSDAEVDQVIQALRDWNFAV